VLHSFGFCFARKIVVPKNSKTFSKSNKKKKVFCYHLQKSAKQQKPILNYYLFLFF